MPAPGVNGPTRSCSPRPEGVSTSASAPPCASNGRGTAGATEGLAVDYAIPGRITIESRRDQQMFHIATLDLGAAFFYAAVPLLSE